MQWETTFRFLRGDACTLCARPGNISSGEARRVAVTVVAIVSEALHGACYVTRFDVVASHRHDNLELSNLQPLSVQLIVLLLKLLPLLLKLLALLLKLLAQPNAFLQQLVERASVVMVHDSSQGCHSSSLHGSERAKQESMRLLLLIVNGSSIFSQ